MLSLRMDISESMASFCRDLCVLVAREVQSNFRLSVFAYALKTESPTFSLSEVFPGSPNRGNKKNIHRKTTFHLSSFSLLETKIMAPSQLSISVFSRVRPTVRPFAAVIVVVVVVVVLFL